MITDLGMNIVNDFLGQTTISSFEIDYNCPENDRPYTPFQQLLCILPIRSFHLLPPEYLALTQGVLNEYFPLDFAVDLNGKTLAWEAIVLIPFVAEALFLAEESKLF
jgi:5'-3' exonuclease